MKTYDPKMIYKIDSEPYYSEVMTREDAEQKARAQAWSQGKDTYLFSVIAIAKAPADVNTVALEAVN